MVGLWVCLADFVYLLLILSWLFVEIGCCCGDSVGIAGLSFLLMVCFYNELFVYLLCIVCLRFGVCVMFTCCWLIVCFVFDLPFTLTLMLPLIRLFSFEEVVCLCCFVPCLIRWLLLTLDCNSICRFMSIVFIFTISCI